MDTSGQQAQGQQAQGYWHPIVYHSQKFTDHEVRYHTYDKELHTIIKCFKQWQYYLEHATHTMRMLTDYNNLKCFMSMKNLSDCQVHAAEELSRYDFDIEYKSSPTNPSDPLSRRPDYARGYEEISGKCVSLNAMLLTLQ
jgi:hypothetical protein